MDKFHLAASVSASCYYRTEPLIIKQIVCFSFRVQSNVCRVHTYITKVYFMESCLFFLYLQNFSGINVLSKQNPGTICREGTPTEWGSRVIDYLPSPSLCGLPSPLSSSCITPHPHTPAFHSPSISFPLSISTLWPPISSLHPVHYVHSTCGAHFISLHLGEAFSPSCQWWIHR